MNRQAMTWTALALVLLGCDETRYGAARASGDAGDDTGDTAAAVEPIEGHWRGPEQVGNCVQVEQWWSFGADGGFVYTVDDQNACYEQYVLAMHGQWGLGPDRLLSLRWVDIQGNEQAQSHTSTVVKTPDDLELLSTQAWVRAPGARSWVNLDEREAAGDRQSTRNVITVEGLEDEGPCRITNTVSLVATGEGGGQATVEYSAPCSIQSDPLIGWDTVVPEGFGESGWEAKRAVLSAQGLDRAPAQINLMANRSFWPVVFWEAARPDVLFRSPVRRRADTPPPPPTPSP